MHRINTYQLPIITTQITVVNVLYEYLYTTKSKH